MEYIMVMGFALLLTIPLVIVFFESSSGTQEQVRVAQVDQLVRKLAETADAVSALGEPSFTTIRAYIPTGVTNISINGREIVFSMETEAGLTEIIGVTVQNVSGSIGATSGYHSIKVEAVGSGVILSET